VSGLVNLLRSGLVRNLGNITAPRLYNRSFAGTKLLIEEYITAVAEAIEDIAALPAPGSGGVVPTYYNTGRTSGAEPAPAGQQHVHFGVNTNGGGDNSSATSTSSESKRPPPPHPATMSNQAKLDFVHDTRQAFGRSTLVLQGGAIFGLVHLGVVKALFLRGLLPRIITGTATGALIAALVAIHTEEELPRVLKGDGIDLSAFAGRAGVEGGGVGARGEKAGGESLGTRLRTLARRVRRFTREGYFLDVKVLEECVRANVGDLTFEEAYTRSKRVLNITVATAGQGGVPTLLNYLTAPNVVSAQQTSPLVLW
jgi:TAG lipase/lysophosphatidylethanolamine acyltransferase